MDLFQRSLDTTTNLQNSSCTLLIFCIFILLAKATQQGIESKRSPFPQILLFLLRAAIL
jgi:hypothetical protein